jgi:hypothetical protein
MALVWHLKPDEILRVADRRVALSVGRDGRVPPLITPRLNPDGSRRAVEAMPAPLQAGPVFVLVELRADEPLRVGGAVIRWNSIRRRQHGVGPALLIDAPRDTHPVVGTEERYSLSRPDLIIASGGGGTAP